MILITWQGFTCHMVTFKTNHRDNTLYTYNVIYIYI